MHFKNKHDQKRKEFVKEKKIKIKKDQIQLILGGAIFAFLIGYVYFILGPISMVAMGLGGGLTL